MWKRIALLAVACGLLCALPLATATDKIVLKNGQDLLGTIEYQSDEGILIKLISGDKKWLEPAEIATVTTTSDGGSQGNADVAAAQAALPSLEQTCAELVAELAKADPQAGAIALVRGKTVYISLGATHGVKVGDAFEIVTATVKIRDPQDPNIVLGEQRDVAGRLTVTSVQPKMSVCELVSGQAEQKNSKGELTRVLPATGGAKWALCLGSIECEPDAAITEPALGEALDAACVSSTLADVIGRSEARYRLDAQCVGADGGCLITVSIVEAQSGRRVREVQRTHKTGLSARDLGFQIALSANLGVILDMGPVERVLDQSFGGVDHAGSAIVVYRAGPQNEIAWVFPDGRIVAAGTNSMADYRRLAQLETTWGNAAKAISSVTASLQFQTHHDFLNASGQFYTDQSEQHQRLFLKPPAQFTLDWPDARAAWAGILARSGGSLSAPTITIDGQKVLTSAGNAFSTADLTRIKYGSHAVTTRRYLWTLIEAFFARPNGRIMVYDQAHNPIIARAMLSKPLDALCLPVPVDGLKFERRPPNDSSRPDRNVPPPGTKTPTRRRLPGRYPRRR